MAKTTLSGASASILVPGQHNAASAFSNVSGTLSQTCSRVSSTLRATFRPERMRNAAAIALRCLGMLYFAVFFGYMFAKML